MRAMTMLSDATASSSLDASQWRLASRPVAVPFKQTLVEECYGHHITWRWVKGHSGVPFQEVADRLARASSTVCSDLSVDDLEQLSGHLVECSGHFDIREFEMELGKVISRYSTHQSFIPASKFEGIGTLPSAFSA